MHFTEQLISFNRAVALDRLGGDEELLKDVARLFLQEYAQVVAEIRQAIVASDAGALQRAAHTLKGSVGNFGAASAVEASRRLEMLGKSGRTEGAAELLDSLETCMERLLPELSALVGEPA